jgi:hypothetical protein
MIGLQWTSNWYNNISANEKSDASETTKTTIKYKIGRRGLIQSVKLLGRDNLIRKRVAFSSTC